MTILSLKKENLNQRSSTTDTNTSLLNHKINSQKNYLILKYIQEYYRWIKLFKKDIDESTLPKYKS